jgi:hypothetical protein
MNSSIVPTRSGSLYEGSTSCSDQQSDEATYYARCIYIAETGEWKPWQVFNLVWRTVRVKSFAQP